MPLMSTVMRAKETAESARLGSPKRSLQVARNRMCFGDVVERHHHQAEKSMAGMAPIQYQCVARMPYW